jgi:hypothetical protein
MAVGSWLLALVDLLFALLGWRHPEAPAFSPAGRGIWRGSPLNENKQQLAVSNWRVLDNPDFFAASKN